jgi:(1->4)-alpha-D-glucan 1-alpha-D-glucosylmutase
MKTQNHKGRNPRATYRIQLRPDFGFEQTAHIVPYLADLGISHLYASPYLQAAAGSTHGYDVVDPTRVNVALGGLEAHAVLCQTLGSLGLGQVIDVVSNHMAIADQQNPWWWDVLENGPSSRYAAYFDVDWEASEDRWPNKVLLPVLGDHYGRILEDGQIHLFYEKGAFILCYHDHRFPVDPSGLTGFLRHTAESCGSELLAFIAESHARLPRPTATAREMVKRRHRDKAVLSELLTRLCRESPDVSAAIHTQLKRLNHDPDALDVLIDQQNYRLAFWRTASRELGYRRFFDIKDLAGLRIEDKEVFDATHTLPITWVQQGWVQGLRIDHPDGLRDPGQYFRRLRESCPGAWIIAEKILGPGEKIPLDWPVAGTTGYDFLNLINALFVDPKGEEALTRFYGDFAGVDTDYTVLVRECKRLVLTKLLESELNRLTSLFVAICERHRRHRDYTRYALREALCETAVYFPVYRSYVSAPKGRVSEADKRYVTAAIEGASEERPDLEPDLFWFLKDILLLRITGSLENELAMRFQQLTGAVMAKGVEDTAFYRYHRLVALNEVGGDPGSFGVPLAQFHNLCALAQAKHPLRMLASTTHDTKRSEDVRSRLAVISEIPEHWSDAVRRWADHNERYRKEDIPDRNTEYLLYQTLVGAWPIDVERTTHYMEKASREAKVYTSWTAPNETYETAVRGFITAVMADKWFCSDLEAFVSDLVLPGRINSLAQTLLKLTAPGVPDIYQGTELWELSLVDPDNRRPVDFALRRSLLDEMGRLSLEQILERMDEGLPKLWLIRRALHLRCRQPELFGPEGGYQPLYAEGGRADHVVAFVRGDAVLTVAPRLMMGMKGGWGDTMIVFPKGDWHNLVTDEDVTGGKPVTVDELLARFPVGVWERR